MREGDRLEDLGIGRRIILKWMFEKWIFDLVDDKDR
jgi:hypothetical protein